jgi:hypothetical protein
MIVSTEPPWLQMRIWRVAVWPGTMDPKSIKRLDSGNHPPSDVLIEKFALGAVEADPSRISVENPPLVQTPKYAR